MAWARTRALWVPFMNAHFKKPGGYDGTDLIALSFDEVTDTQKAKPLSFKEAKTLFGSRIKKQ